MPAESFEPGGTTKPQESGFARPEAGSGPSAPGRPTFLLDPGGQDYVGNNSYDDSGRMDQ